MSARGVRRSLLPELQIETQNFGLPDIVRFMSQSDPVTLSQKLTTLIDYCEKTDQLLILQDLLLKIAGEHQTSLNRDVLVYGIKEIERRCTLSALERLPYCDAIVSDPKKYATQKELQTRLEQFTSEIEILKTLIAASPSSAGTPTTGLPPRHPPADALATQTALAKATTEAFLREAGF